MGVRHRAVRTTAARGFSTGPDLGMVLTIAATKAIHIRRLKLFAGMSNVFVCQHECLPAKNVVDDLLPILAGRRADLVLPIPDLPGNGGRVQAPLRMSGIPEKSVSGCSQLSVERRIPSDT